MPAITTYIRDKVHYALLAAIIASCVFPHPYTSWLIVLCSLHWLIDPKLFTKIKISARQPLTKFLWLFYLAYIISALISHNQREGFAIVERRSALLVLPLLILGQPIQNNHIRNIILAFVGSLIIAFIICLVYAVSQYLQKQDLSVFFYHPFVRVLKGHAVYIASYCVIGIQGLLFFRREIDRWFLISGLFILLVFIVFLNSKMILFCLLIGLIVFGLREWSLKKAFGVSVIVGLCLFAAISVLPNTKQRFLEEWRTDWRVVKQDSFRYDTPFTGLSLRLVFWKLSVSIIREQNTWIKGVNTGDFQDILNSYYAGRGIYMGNPELGDTGYRGYGPHNQYIELLLSMGLPLLVFFILMLVYLFRKALLEKNYLLFQLLLLFSLFFWSESVLSMDKGIIPFVYFLCLFTQYVAFFNNDRK